MDGDLGRTLIIIVFGLIIGGFGVWLLLRHKKLAALCTAQISGVVHSIERSVSRSRDSDGTRQTSVTYAPTFMYTVGGVEYIKTSGTSVSHLKLKTGDAVTVLYNPDNPDHFLVKEFKSPNTLSILLTIVGVVIIALGIYTGITG